MGTLISAPGKDDIRKRLVAELATDPSWRKGFLQSASDIPVPQAAAFLYIIADLRRTKAPVTLREMRPALEEWLNNGNVELAQRAWAMVVGRELVANPGFEEAIREGANTPPYWDVPDDDLSQTSLAAPSFDPKNRSLSLGAGASVSQRLLLSPGSYTISLNVDPDVAAATFRVELNCRGQGPDHEEETRLAPAGKWQERHMKVVVPVRDCHSQRLAIVSSAGNAGSFWIDNVWVRAGSR
jgi:hypothetical protein